MTLAANADPSFAQTLIAPIERAARNFTPNLFTATMGTGALALVLNQYPFEVPGLHLLGAGLWITNIALFSVFCGLYAARWALAFDEAAGEFDHPVMSMFLGAIPMGLATIVNGFVVFGPDWLGAAAYSYAYALWRIDVVLALGCGLAVPYFMFTRQAHQLERMTAVWLIPIVAAEVAASSAAGLAPHLDVASAYPVLVAGYVLWAYSVPLALSVLVLLFLRLALHKLPEREMGASGWLALGPIGTGALGLVGLGDNAPAIFAAHGLPAIGEAAQGLGVLGGLLLWGYGLWWLGLAILKTARYLRGGLPFDLGWWAFTFPLAVYTLGTLALARPLRLAALADFGAALGLALFVFWLVVAFGTARWLWRARRPRPPRQAAAATIFDTNARSEARSLAN
jgi:C4-dicarboxylate transporter/malic acid transport protein